MARFTILIAALAFLPAGGHAAEALPDGFVRLSEVAPAIRQDMRYARTFNFTGAVVPGYLAPECILTEPAAAALQNAEATLNAQGYALVVYDCYRPAHAVTSFVTWVNEGRTGDLLAIFSPETPRSELIERGYIADKSSHSRGSTVDVGMVRLGEAPMIPTAEGTGRCDAPLGARARETSLDMGTAYDCFSPRSAVAAKVDDAATENRRVQREAMTGAGFATYAEEWWHYTLHDEPYPDTRFDFPVE